MWGGRKEGRGVCGHASALCTDKGTLRARRLRCSWHSPKQEDQRQVGKRRAHASISADPQPLQCVPRRVRLPFDTWRRRPRPVVDGLGLRETAFDRLKTPKSVALTHPKDPSLHLRAWQDGGRGQGRRARFAALCRPCPWGARRRLSRSPISLLQVLSETEYQRAVERAPDQRVCSVYIVGI